MHQDRRAATRPRRIVESQRAGSNTTVVNLTHSRKSCRGPRRIITNALDTVKDRRDLQDLQDTGKVVEVVGNVVTRGAGDVHVHINKSGWEPLGGISHCHLAHRCSFEQHALERDSSNYHCRESLSQSLCHPRMRVCRYQILQRHDHRQWQVSHSFGRESVWGFKCLTIESGVHTSLCERESDLHQQELSPRAQQDQQQGRFSILRRISAVSS